MKQLILIRHGEFDAGSIDLNKAGLDQMQKFAIELDGTKPAIYTSTGPRSIESAQIIADKLGVNLVSKEIFGSNRKEDQVQYYQSAWDYLQAQEYKSAVLIVSKGEFLNGFIEFVAEKVHLKNLPGHQIQRGEAITLSLF